MANHAYIKTEKVIDPHEVFTLVTEIIKTKLCDLFDVIPSMDSDFIVIYKSDPDFQFSFWIDDDIDYEDNTPKIIRRNSVLEFRHGHLFNFMWWVEGVIRENLGKSLNGRMFDDGCEIDPKPNPERYDSFEIFTNGKKSLWFNHHDKLNVPTELIEKLKLDF